MKIKKTLSALVFLFLTQSSLFALETESISQSQEVAKQTIVSDFMNLLSNSSTVQASKASNTPQRKSPLEELNIYFTCEGVVFDGKQL